MNRGLAYYDLEGTTAVVTLNHPPMNALDVPTKEALNTVFEELDGRRDEIRAVILRGSGGKAFAAGADIKTFLELKPDTARRRLVRSHQIYEFIENFQWPVIAAIHGFCLGAGLELALCCDIRYAEEGAHLGFPEVRLSIFPGNGGTQRARHQVPLGRLKELIYSGDMVTGEEAFHLGLVEKVTPDGEVMASALALAEKIAKRGPLGISAAKRVLNRTRDMPMASGLALETDFWSSLTATEDMKEGASAFLEKRKPVYKGR